MGESSILSEIAFSWHPLDGIANVLINLTLSLPFIGGQIAPGAENLIFRAGSMAAQRPAQAILARAWHRGEG